MPDTSQSRGRGTAVGGRALAAFTLLVALGAASVAAQPLRNGPLPQPLPLFPADNWWNVDISDAPVDPGSADFIAFIGDSQGLHPDFGGNAADPPEIYGIPYVSVPASQPLVPVTFVDYGDESDHGFPGRPTGYPIPDEAKAQPYWIEGGHPGNVEPDGDRHMLIVDRDRRILYELYRAHWNASRGRWEAGSGAIFSLDSNDRRPEGWTSSDAAGLAVLPGLIRHDEAFGAQPIRHALRVTVRRTDGHVWPASHTAGDTPGALPMGARLRLKPEVDISGYAPEVRRIFQAMKTYGLIVADNGSDMYVQGVYDTRWDNDVLNPAFDSITAGDFEVVELGWRPPTGGAGGGVLREVPRCRLIDTRLAFGPNGGPALPPGVSRVVRGTGRCGVPASARALRVDLQVLQAPRQGRLQWFAGDEGAGGAASMPFQRPRGRRNGVRMPLAASGSGAFALRATVGVHVLVEVTGYYQ
jgi:hypothetical protein